MKKMHLTEVPFRRGLAVSLFLLWVAGHTNAFAAGFFLREHSVSGLAEAHAGSAAKAEDASTVFSNPAGMSYLDQPQLSSGAHVVFGEAQYRNERALTGGVVPTPGQTRADGVQSVYVPALYYVHPLDEDVALGISVTSPFGVHTDYDDNWVGRYFALDTYLATINIQPSVSWRIHEQWRVGVGLNLQHARTALSNAIPFGGLPAPDGRISLEGKSWAVGYNVGIIYEPVPSTRIGVHYRSAMTHDIKGDSNTSQIPAVVLALRPALRDQPFEAELHLPAMLDIAVVHAATERLDLMATAQWMQWSRLKEVSIDAATSGINIAQLELGYEDVWYLAGGMNYDLLDDLTLRLGYAYDASPVPNDQLRSARFPDNDRHWLTTGLTYRYSDAVSVDLAYARIFFVDTRIDLTDAATGNTLRGDYGISGNVASVQVNYRF